MSASSHLREITSRSNPLVQAAVRLHRRRERRDTGRWLAEGPHAVDGALAGAVVETLFVVDPAAAVSGVDTVVVPDSVMAKIVTTRTHQGVAAVCRRPDAPESLHVAGAALCLVEAADPGNVGGAIRTAAHAGLDAVILTDGSADPFGPRAARAAAGALPAMPVHEQIAIDELIEAIDPARLVALDAQASASIFAPLPPSPVLIFGSEAHGLPPTLLARCAHHRRIPRSGTIGQLDSLNLAAAVAVATYAAADLPGDPT